MPITVRCRCGAEHQLPDHASGRKARCRTCGNVFLVPPAETNASVAEPTDSPPEESITTVGRSFVADAIRAFGLFGRFPNLVSCLVIALFGVIGLAVASFFPMGVGAATVVRLLVLAFVYGVICSFCLNSITAVANGEDDLPGASTYTNTWDGVFEPLLQFAGSVVLLALPALIASFVLHSPLSKWPNVHPLVLALAGVGLFLWPITILAVALGGLTVFYRPDLLLRAIAAAPAQYLFICLLLVVAAAIHYLGEYAASLIAPAVSRWAVTVITSTVQYYSLIVAMCLIGLFYRHYHRRFPWGME